MNQNKFLTYTRTRLYVATAFIALLLAATTYVSLSSISSLGDSARWHSHTWEVMSKLHEMDSTFKSLEEVHRYYIITHDPVSLEQEGEQYKEVFRKIDELDQLMADNPVQVDNARALRKATEDRIVIIRENTKIRNTKGFEAARDHMIANNHDVMQKKIGNIQRTMVVEEDRLLKIRSDEEATRLKATYAFILLGKSIILVIIGFTIFILVRQSTILDKSNQEIINVNEELKQFAYVASHDLKAPLRAISNLAGWIVEDIAEKTPAIEKHVSLLLGRIKRMENLIDGILQYSRVGRFNIETKRLAIGQIVKDAIGILPPNNFSFNIQSDFPYLFANEVVLLQIFSNLISNAVKHHDREDGRVDIGWRDIGRHYQFWVKDDGPGIDPKHFDKLFVPFQTLQPRDTRESTGIGLALCKKIVEREGGKIWLESDVGKGASFIFTWPK